MDRNRLRVFRSRTAVAIVSMTVTAVVVAGGLAGALPGTGSVDGNDIQKGAVKSRQIANNTIRGKDIRTGAVRSSDIRDGSVASVDITDGTVASVDITDNTITSTDIKDGTIASADIANGTVTSTDIAAGVLPLWARVDSNGSGTPTIIAQSGNINYVGRFGTGTYYVGFDRTISNCGWIAAITAAESGSPGSGDITVAQPTAGTSTELFVEFRTSAGALSDPDPTDGFTIVVYC